jgi:hypothetical protein
VTHLYVRKYSGPLEEPYQIVSRLYVGWYSNHATRQEALNVITAMEIDMPLDNTPTEGPGGGRSDEFAKLQAAANEIVTHLIKKGQLEGLDVFQLGLFVQNTMAVGLATSMLRQFRYDTNLKSTASNVLQTQLAVLREGHTRVLAALGEIDPDYTDPEAKEL